MKKIREWLKGLVAWWKYGKFTLWFRTRINKTTLSWPDFIGALLFLIGLFGFIPGPIPYIPWFSEFYQAIKSELIGIGIAVILIDNANEILRRSGEKKRLILQMGSPDNAFAREALRQLLFLHLPIYVLPHDSAYF